MTIFLVYATGNYPQVGLYCIFISSSTHQAPIHESEGCRGEMVGESGWFSWVSYLGCSIRGPCLNFLLGSVQQLSGGAWRMPNINRDLHSMGIHTFCDGLDMLGI